MKRLLTSLILVFAFSCAGTGIHSDGQDMAGTPETPESSQDQSSGLSEIGQAITTGTELVMTVKSDTSYVLTPGLTVTEFGYVGKHGLRMKTWFMKVDLNTEGLTIESIYPSEEPLTTMTDMAKEFDSSSTHVWAGVNTDFFSSTGPQGILHHDGKCIKGTYNAKPARDRSFFFLSKDNTGYISSSLIYESISSGGNIEEAFSGAHILLSDGTIPTFGTEGLNSKSHPRTAVGCSKDGKTIWFMVVDGRQEDWSNGMYYEEMAAIFKAIGAHNASNLDGGGSSTFFIRDEAHSGDSKPFKVLNRPSDGSERKVACGAVIVSQK